MLQAISKYIQSISMVIIFTTFVHLIVPSGDFKKYIKLVLGLVIIITVLTPIDKLIFKNKPNYIDILKRYEIDIENTVMQTQSSYYMNVQADMILENYKQKLMPQMVDVIEKSSDVTVVDLDVGVNDDRASNKYGAIHTINMIVMPLSKETTKKKIIIPKIRVGSKTGYGDPDVTKEGQIEKNIKTSLIDFYNLSNVNINITVQKNS